MRPTALSSQPIDAHAALVQLRQETFWLALPLLHGAGFLLLALTGTRPNLLQAGLLALLLLLLALLI